MEWEFICRVSIHPTYGAFHWESFTIDSDIFLAVANWWPYTGQYSKIYKWNGSSFVEFQSILTYGAVEWESFTIGSDTFLAVANGNKDFTFNTHSKIYKWNGSSFVEFQSILTYGAADWESFTIGSDIFLALANGQDDSIFNVDSKIYRWNGSSFVNVQSIPTQGANYWESFTIGADTFLAVTNWNNDSTYSIYSKIYKYKETPHADAGEDQIVYNSVTLDGSGSYDTDGGQIVSWEWELIYQADTNANRTASGEIVTVENLSPGFYHVTLTVTDNDGLSDSDEMILAAGCGESSDADGDGYSVEDDCDDHNSAINPGAAEVCGDGIDNDCDTEIDEGFDQDGDGFTYCGEGEENEDCDDLDANINPDAIELPGNVIDENCDGSLGTCDPNASWKNHGEYVRCVAHEVEELVNTGVITEEEGNKLVYSAAQSDIGKK